MRGIKEIGPGMEALIDHAAGTSLIGLSSSRARASAAARAGHPPSPSKAPGPEPSEPCAQTG